MTDHSVSEPVALGKRSIGPALAVLVFIALILCGPAAHARQTATPPASGDGGASRELINRGFRTSIGNEGRFRVEYDPARRRQLLLNFMEGNRTQRAAIQKIRQDEFLKRFGLKGMFGGGSVPSVPRDQPPPPAVPTSAPAQQATATDWLPKVLPLDHSACFRIEDEGELTLDQLAARLGGSDEARSRLQDWGWQASAYRTFACDTPPESEAGWIDVSVHQFADPDSAQQAVEYFAAKRAEGTALVAGPPPAIGDRAEVLSGSASNGTEFTLYASQGPRLIRVTGVSPMGIPFMNVLTVARVVMGAHREPLPSADVPPLPLPTATPVLTATSIPTASPTPSPTPLPRPTATLPPTPISVPTATRTVVPTSTAVPQPTPTPLPILTPVSVPPTPAALPTVGTTETEIERMERINQDLSDYGVWVITMDPDQRIANAWKMVKRSTFLLAEMGLLGGGNGRSDIYSGPESARDASLLAESWIDSMGPGVSGEPRVIYPSVFQRLMQTDMSALSPEQQTAISNGALLTVVPWMPYWLEAQLDLMASNYLDAVRRGETEQTYPEYLSEHGYASPFD